MTVPLFYLENNPEPPNWLMNIWTQVQIWIRIPRKKRTADQVQSAVKKSLTREGFYVHRIHMDYNKSQRKFYVRPVISGRCNSTKKCVDILKRGLAGEVRLEAGDFVFQRDRINGEPIFNRKFLPRRRIRHAHGSIHSVVLPPTYK